MDGITKVLRTCNPKGCVTRSFLKVLLALLLPSFCLADTYLCTSKQYQFSFGSSMQCPNIEQKVHRALLSYLRWAYRDLGGRKEALAAYRSFECHWVQL